MAAEETVRLAARTWKVRVKNIHINWKILKNQMHQIDFP